MTPPPPPPPPPPPVWQTYFPDTDYRDTALEGGGATHREKERFTDKLI
jgi:hypothetical protein